MLMESSPQPSPLNVPPEWKYLQHHIATYFFQTCHIPPTLNCIWEPFHITINQLLLILSCSNLWRVTNEEKRALDRMHLDLYNEVRQAAEAHRQV